MYPRFLRGAKPDRCEDEEIGRFVHGYDPRVCGLADRYYVTWATATGVLTSCNGFVYSFGASLVDLEEPWRVIYRTEPYLLNPREIYECVGDVPNLVFACTDLVDAPTGRMAIYYGGADTVTCLAFARFDELMVFVKTHSK